MITNITSPTLEEKTNSQNSSTFIISPLYPGYGSTIGNSLRRVLLSTLTGYAITSVKFDGVTHEFSTLKGVKEDVLEIILNLKSIRIKAYTDEPFEITLSKKGSSKILASDFKKSDQYEIINQDQIIATLDKGADISLSAVVEKGRGYWTIDQRASILGTKMPLGTIAVDSLFSPVTHVSMQVEDTRVGQMTNYNKLILTVQTDGTITSKDAVLESIKILRDQFDTIRNDIIGVKPMDEEKAVLEISKDSDISEANLSSRVVNALSSAGIQTVADIININEEGLKSIKGLGAKGVNEILNLKSALEKQVK